MLQRIKCLNGFQLKIIAIILMTIDHAGATLFPQYIVLRYIGRLAFPIFAFLCVEGIIHTRNPVKYMMQLGIFALISEIPFDMAFKGKMWDTSSQNIFFTLLLGVIAIYIMRQGVLTTYKYSMIVILGFLAELLSTDYGMLGVWLIVGLYMTRDEWWKMAVTLIVINVLLYGGIQSFGALAILFIVLYDGTRGKGMKYFFYIYYPVHILILFAISTLWI